MRVPVVAIVGRPNVGKSTLFNRLARRRISLVEDSPGGTRDRIYADGVFDDMRYTLIGAGRIGATHAAVLADVADVDHLAIADLEPERAVDLAAQFDKADPIDLDRAFAAVDAVIGSVVHLHDPGDGGDVGSY